MAVNGQNRVGPDDLKTRAQIERIVDPDSYGALYLSAAGLLSPDSATTSGSVA